MFELYVGFMIVGMGLVSASFFGTDHDADVDADLDLDVDADVDLDADADFDADHDMDADVAHGIGIADALWLPVLSLRFWIFATGFFGLTGTILEGFSLAGPRVVLGTSLGMGLFSGYTVALLVRSLRRKKVSSDIDPQRDYVGRTGEVLLDVKPDDPGQVRLNVKGVFMDLCAEVAPGGRTLTRGSAVKVTGYEGGKLRVEATVEATKA